MKLWNYDSKYRESRVGITISQEIGPMPMEKNSVKKRTQVNGIQSNEGPKPGCEGGSDSSIQLYRPNPKKLPDMNRFDNVSSGNRPAVSISNPEVIEPNNWRKTTIMAAPCGFKDRPKTCGKLNESMLVTFTDCCFSM